MGNSCKKITNKKNSVQNNTKEEIIDSTNTKEEILKEIDAYASSVQMDGLNKNLYITLRTEGTSAFIKKAFDDPIKPGRVMSYAESRGYYG
jgi:hypothetical protein